MMKPWDVWMDEHLIVAFSNLYEEMKGESMERFSGLSIEEIKQLLLDETNDDDLMALWNDYCEEINAHDDMIFYNEEETLRMMCDSYMSVAQRITYGNYNYSHEYLKLNGYANFESADLIEWLIYVDDLAEWLHEKQKAE